MEKNLPLHLQEVIFSSSDPKISRQISKLEKSGFIKKIAPRIFSPNLEESSELIIRRNIFLILGKLYPGAILSHRSALEFKPTPTGKIFLTHSYSKNITLPGITIGFLKGRGPIKGDNILSGELFASQRERAFLENLQESRKSGSELKTLAQSDIEERLDKIASVNGESELNLIRDKARIISIELNLTKEFKKLDIIISALLSTHSSKVLKTSIASARAYGIPYDSKRNELFEILYQELQQFEFKYQEDKSSNPVLFKNFAFYESYFSNYIEGTEFELEEAKQIIESGIPLSSRNEDSHDVLGTYRLVSNKKEMKITPSTPEDLLNIIKYRHKVIMSSRSNKKPGEFKDKNNRAGQTAFVDLTLVKGTLIKSFDFYHSLKHPFSRAAFIMFAISEIHPFLDGNGRLARVMMNAELVREGQCKILIPTVFRDDYLGTLRKLTRQKEPQAYVRMLSHIYDYSKLASGLPMDEMQLFLKKTNAFKDSNEAKLKFVIN